MQEITTHRLRQIIKNELLDALKSFKESMGKRACIGDESVSDYEVERFIFTNPYFDELLAIQLTDRDFAGFHPSARIYVYGEAGFIELVRKWARSDHWLRSFAK